MKSITPETRKNLDAVSVFQKHGSDKFGKLEIRKMAEANRESIVDSSDYPREDTPENSKSWEPKYGSWEGKKN